MLFGVGKLGSQFRKTAGAGDAARVDYTPSNPGPETNTYAYDPAKLERDQHGTDEWYRFIITSARNFCWNSDGTIFFYSQQSQEAVYAVSVSTAYDLSTVSGSPTTYNIVDLGLPAGWFFSSDGTKLFVILSTDIIHRINLTTAFQPVATDTSVANVNLATLSTNVNTNPKSGSISTDGTIMHIWDSARDSIFQYTMSTAFDLSTLSLDVEFTKTTLTSDGAFALDGDGTKLYVVDNSATDSTYKIEQYNLSTAFDIDTRGSVQSVIEFGSDYIISDVEHLAVSPDGTRLYIASNDSVIGHQMHTAHDLSTIVPDGVDFYNRPNSLSQGVENTVVSLREAYFNADGTKLIFLDATDDSVVSVNLDKPYSLISGLGNTETTFSVNSQESFPLAFFLKPDGTSFYVCGLSSDTFFQYDMTTAFDISTASYSNKSLSHSAQEGFPTGIHFKPDGTKLFMTGFNSDALNEYALSTAWDISTASFTQAESAFVDGAMGLTANGDGTQFLTGDGADGLKGINLGTGYDASTKTSDVSGLGTNWLDDVRLGPRAHAPTWQKSGEVMLMSQSNKIIKLSANDKRMVEQIYSPEIVIQSPLTSADDARNYHVLNIEFRADALPSDYTGRLFIGHKLRGNSAFDLCVGAVQILNSSSARVHAWQGNDFTSWETTTNEGNASPTDYVEVINYFNTGSYASIASGSTDARWNIASSTADLNTGAADGVSTTYGSGGTAVLPISGILQVAQTASTNFVYTPTGSGSSSSHYIWMRSPEVTLASGIHQLRIAYLFSTNSTATKFFDTLQVFWADADN